MKQILVKNEKNISSKKSNKIILLLILLGYFFKVRIKCIIFIKLLKDKGTFFFLEVEELYCELNYHDQKIRWTLMHDMRKHWTAVSTLLGLISSVYCDHHHWRSKQQLQIAVQKLYNWATSSYCWGSLTPLQRCSQCILLPQLTGTGGIG